MSDRWTDDDRDRGRYVRNDDLDELGRDGRPPARRALNRGGYGPGFGHSPTDTPVGPYARARQERPADREERSWFPHEVSDEAFNHLYRQGREGERNGPPLKGGQPQFGEHRGKGPRNFRRTDERIMEELNERLTYDSHLDASDIEVACTGGEVTLNGTVAGKSDKRRAEDIADDVGGVGHVQNNLRVRQPATPA